MGQILALSNSIRSNRRIASRKSLCCLALLSVVILSSAWQADLATVQDSPGAQLGGSARGLTKPQAAPRVQSPPALQALLSSADSVLKEMSRITGLPIKAPLQKKVVDRAEIRRYLTQSLHAEYSPQEIHKQEAVLKAFGLVSPEFNLADFLVTFYTEQAAGVYDPRSKTMLIASWIAPEMQQMVLAHELTHALQDQNFELEKFLRAVRDDEDAGNARQALVEGYATAAMIQKVIEPAALSELPSLSPFVEQAMRTQTQEFPAFSSAPFFFRFQALFPYTQGMSFVQRGLANGGWEKLNQIFSRPPATTKEIFQPGVYFGQESLPRISLKGVIPLTGTPPLRLIDENAMGELGYYALLGQFISEAEARSVSQGWEADRYVVYENAAAKRYSLVSRTRWASSETSLAFFRDYHSILARKYAELKPDPRSTQDLFIGSTAAGTVILVRDNVECLWAEGVPASRVDSMLTYLKSQSATTLPGRHGSISWRIQ
jgi:hypothetical protein